MLGKVRLAKCCTRVVDENKIEVINIQMRNYNNAAPKGDARHVINVKESGETLVLAAYDENFWSLLDSKWSLKQTSNPDGPLFELWSAQMVKFYSRTKLEYELKYSTKLRSHQDFMTVVEFSKQHPYGKDVGLLNLKLGSIEIKFATLKLKIHHFVYF